MSEQGTSRPSVGGNPLGVAQAMDRPAKPRRFYKSAALGERDGGFGVTLDGRFARTPKRSHLLVPDRRVAEEMAAEWEAQADDIDPMTMPVTRIVNSAIDGVAERADAVRAEIVAYCGSDLIAYRAGSPQGLVARQALAWDPLVAWAAAELDAPLLVGEGIMPIRQPQSSLDAVSAAIAGVDSLPLAALHVVTTLTGSAIIALSLSRGLLKAEQAWTAAHVDEDWEISQWGEDAEASARRAARWKEMRAAAFVLGRD